MTELYTRALPHRCVFSVDSEELSLRELTDDSVLGLCGSTVSSLTELFVSVLRLRSLLGVLSERELSLFDERLLSDCDEKLCGETTEGSDCV